jgi:hypothetical protein
MPLTRRGWIALGIGLVVLAVGVGVLGPERVYEFTEGHHGPLTAIATLVIALFTIVLGVNGSSQLRHGVKVERAYLTGGGDIIRDLAGKPVLAPDGSGRRQFEVHVGNYGKTAAYLTHYDIHFDVLADVKAELKSVAPSERFEDRLVPGGQKAIAEVPVMRADADVVYGAFWYRDIWNEEHRFRFILSIGKDNRTRPNVVGVHKDYGKWD